MKIKLFLLIAPAILSLILLQSYFWVPKYETQTKGNPERVWKFIIASIGDAKILNPILNADTSSGQITNMVFEGLLDHDEELKLRGRLATDWTITEKAYLIIDTEAKFQDGTQVSPSIMLQRLEILMDKTPRLKNLVIKMELLPAAEKNENISIFDQSGKPISLQATLQVPPRIQFFLKEVDQKFFELLKPVIGADYADNATMDKLVQISPSEHRNLIKVTELLPIFEHNPIILFNLRKGVYFQDGHEFDAEDVNFTYEAIMNPKNISPRTSDFEPIKYIKIIDKHKIQVVYKRLFSPAINAWSMGILPEHLLNQTALQKEMDERNLSVAARDSFGMRDSKFNRNPIGTGPFTFTKWKSDEYIHLTRYEDYWEGPTEYKEYYYRVIPDSVTQEVEFRSGAIDTYQPEPHQAVRYKNDAAYQSFSSLSFAYTYIGYNNRRELLKNKQVRQALGMAINVDEIIEYILYGEGERITGPHPKNTQWYNHDVAALPYDPKAAQQILSDLGWHKNTDGWLEKDGKIFEFNLITNNGNLQRKAIMTIAQNSWHKLGIKCNTQLFEWAVFLRDFVNKGEFDAVVLGWSMGIDPDLYQIWHSSQAGNNQLNFVGYKNSEVDKLIVQIRQEYDFGTQQQLTYRLHKLLAEEQPYTFLYAPLSNLVLDKKIVKVEPDGSYSKIKPTKTGSVFYDFNRWKKLDFTPKW